MAKFVHQTFFTEKTWKLILKFSRKGKFKSPSVYLESLVLKEVEK